MPKTATHNETAASRQTIPSFYQYPHQSNYLCIANGADE